MLCMSLCTTPHHKLSSLQSRLIDLIGGPVDQIKKYMQPVGVSHSQGLRCRNSVRAQMRSIEM